MRALSISLLLCACGDNAALPSDAAPDVTDASVADDLSIDSSVDAPVTGLTIGGTALGVRSTVVLAVTTGTDTRHVVINADGPFQFPGLVPEGSSIVVTTPSCDVLGGSRTGITADVNTVEVYCAGVVELTGIAFGSGVPAVTFASALSPAFDPGADAYTGTRPFFMDDTDLVSVTLTPAYPTVPTISVYADPTFAGQASPYHVLGAAVPVRLQHPATLDRTYEFTLVPAKPAQEAALKAAMPAAFDMFGTVALSGDRLVVGAPYRGGTGAAFVQRRGAAGWTQEQVVQPTAIAGAHAGAAVAIDGDVLVIGAPADAIDISGRAYVYRYNAASTSWLLDGGGTLSATTPAADASCGASVAISGARIIIGCPGEKGKGNAMNAGAVYMFRYDAPSSTWVADGTFKGAKAGDFFGSAVGLSGASAIVGAPFEADGTTIGAGGARVLVRGASTWAQQGTTLRGDAVTGSHFGQAVAISGDDVIVGAPDTSSGAAYVFQRVAGAWSRDGPKLVPALGAPELVQFGSSVAIDGTHVVVGAPKEDGGILDAGMVHAYRREADGWTNTHTVGATNPSASDFGACVSLDGEWFAVGAPRDGSIASQSGAVYVFR
jgi:hypothetical protein